MKLKKRIELLSLLVIFTSCQSVSDSLSVQIGYPTLPVLTMKETNPVMKIQLVKSDLSDCTVQQIVVSLQGSTNPKDIRLLSLYQANSEGRFANQKKLAEAKIEGNKAIFNTSIVMSADTMTYWMGVGLHENIKLTDRLRLTCLQIMTTDGSVKIPVVKEKEPLRVGVAVRQHGQDHVHTSRIPGLATSKKGTLLAIYDARYESSRDLQGNIDIGLNRSTDGGVTWLPFQVVLDRKEWGGLPEKFNGVSDPCILVDKHTGTIFVACLWMHGVLDNQTGKWVKGLTKKSKNWQHQWRGRGSQPGFSIKQTCQFLLTKSTDDGKTWSKPINITPTTKRKEWWLYAPAPGHGITLDDGTLVFPTQGRDQKGVPFSNITYSQNGGETWTASNPAFKNVTENMVVQLREGSLMLNMRDNSNRKNTNEHVDNGRRICTTKDLGKTWVEHLTSHKVLTEPTCMASLHRQGNNLFFSNPNSRVARKNMTIKRSTDEGMTWPKEHWIVLDEQTGRGYSCLTSVNDSTIGILYEGSQADLIFQQIPLKDF